MADKTIDCTVAFKVTVATTEKAKKDFQARALIVDEASAAASALVVGVAGSGVTDTVPLRKAICSVPANLDAVKAAAGIKADAPAKPEPPATTDSKVPLGSGGTP